MGIYCECINWTRNYTSQIMTNHHRDCPNYNIEKDVKEIVQGLIAGIEKWARDEDGIHDECWEAYSKAKIFLGQKIKE